MPAQSVFLSDSPGFTFVNYGKGSDFAYRKHARIHNAHRHTLQHNRRKQCSERQGNLPLAESRNSTPPLQDALTTFARNPFENNLFAIARKYESIWMRNFETLFSLPALEAPPPGILDPRTSFLKVARASQIAYQNIVTLTAATLEARQQRCWGQDKFILHRQAQILEGFRQTVDYYQNSQCRLDRNAYQDVYAAVFSFIDPAFGREAGYDATIDAITAVFCLPQHVIFIQAPTVEWIKTLMPRPSLSLGQRQLYRSRVLWKTNKLLDFIEECQENASALTDHERAVFFQRGSPVHVLITSPLSGSETQRPYPGFHVVCLHRILFILHLFAISIRKNPATSLHFAETLQRLASSCLQYEGLHAITLFLWSLLWEVDSDDHKWAEREQLFTIPMKYLVVTHSISFVDIMRALLFAEQSQHGKHSARSLDIDPLRRSMKDFYELSGSSASPP